MKIHEIKTKTIELDSTDIKQAIILYLKGRGVNEIEESNIDLKPSAVAATIVLQEEINPQ
jgi:hypothetical protein